MAYDIDREKQEAIVAGRKATQSLEAAYDELSSAKNWGVFDILGGGFISSMVKHSKMNNASDYMRQAKADLMVFNRELNDVSRELNLNFNDFDIFSIFDCFSDNFISDLVVQDRINKAKAQVEEAIDRVEDIVNTLEKY